MKIYNKTFYLYLFTYLAILSFVQTEFKILIFLK